MARDDYHVVVFRILTYLYACLKAGEAVSMQYLCAEEFDCVQSYWDYIIQHLYEDGYIEGVEIVLILSKKRTCRITQDIMITPKGIEYLQDNSIMAKTREFLKTLKETIPGI